MQEPIIEVKNLSKKYNIVHQQGGYIALRDVLTETAKHPFKFLKQKTKKAIGRETKEGFWALKDVSFNVKKGEAIGIIGANGAGKSTLLKILSKITPPTEGEVKFKGRVSSLLEVGTGFHPELTGRENIFLNGAILGMAKKEIAEKFDSIVKFAEIEKFLDTPVKRYSSGMYVRLAFAVAAHMEPDILIVDEVLAVGDAEFQKKCLGKMDEVTKTAGRTILFVSHNMGAIEKLCKRCVWLDGGEVKMIGETKDVVEVYLSQTRGQTSTKITWQNNNPGDQEFIKFKSMQLMDNNGHLTHAALAENPLYVSITYDILKPVQNMQIGFSLNSEDKIIFKSVDLLLPKFKEVIRKPGTYTSTCIIPSNFLNQNRYFISLFSHIPNQKMLANEESILKIDVLTKTTFSGVKSQPGLLRPLLEWKTTAIKLD